jgi:enoyl-CoA hydratase/carnithine racemase
VSAQLSIERKSDVALLRLGNDQDLPRLSLSLLREIERAFIGLVHEPGACGVVITGNEWAFATGAELVEVSELTASSALSFSVTGQRVFARMERFPKPVVAAIRGYCLGGGLDLALACHLRVASTDAVFGHPGASLGIMTGFGGTQRLPRLIGRAQAMEMLAVGRTLTAAEAHSWGLVNCIVVPEQTLEVARELARGDGRA